MRSSARRVLFLNCALTLSLVPCMQTPAQSTRAAHEQAEIAVVGNDYAFIHFPATIGAGKTLFSFENRGKVRHEMSVVLLTSGVTLEQVAQAGEKFNNRRVVDSLVGILVARPGESSGGRLFVDLQPGRRYLVYCTLKDSPDAPRHTELGMITSFEVK